MHALITGASSGIGRALSSILIEKYNFNITAVGRKEPGLLSLQKKYPSNVFPIIADVSKRQDRAKIVDMVNRRDNLTHLINNAGIAEPVSSIEKLSLESFQYQFKVIAEGPLFLTRDLIPYFKENTRVLFTSSGAAFKPFENIGSYCICKAALEMVHKTLMQEYKDAAFYFASLRPGGVDTPMIDTVLKNSSAECPTYNLVLEKRKKGLLLTPNESASFMAWVLLHTANNLYEKHWNINDDSDYACYKKE